MNERSRSEIELPVPEIRFRQLRCLFEAHKQTVENKKTNLVALDRLVRAMLRKMEEFGEDFLPKSSVDLYQDANVDDNVYSRNFGSVYGVILCIKKQIVKEIDEIVIGPFGVFTYEGTLSRLFDYLSQAPEEEESARTARMRFALKRFSDDFWETAFHGFYPIIVKGMEEEELSIKDLVYSRFVMGLRLTLKKWSEQGFSVQYRDGYMALLGTLVGLEERRLKEIKSVLKRID